MNSSNDNFKLRLSLTRFCNFPVELNNEAFSSLLDCFISFIPVQFHKNFIFQFVSNEKFWGNLVRRLESHKVS